MGFYDYYPVNTGGTMGVGSTETNARLGNRQITQSYINEGLNFGSSSRQAPQGQSFQSSSATINQAPQGQARGFELDQARRLQAIAGGGAKGSGEMAVDRQIASAIANQQAQARMSRGSTAGVGGLAAARGQQQIGVSGAGLAAQAGLQDRMAAEGQLASTAGQMRGADIGLATSQAGLQQQTSLANQQAQQQTELANLDARLKQTGMNDQARLAYLQQLTGMDAIELQARISKAERQQQQFQGMMSAMGGGIGALAMSDRNLKTDIKDASEQVDEMLEGMSPYSYRYKDERFGVGPRAGIMAQDLERSEAGRRLVVETPDGKGVDINKAVSAALAAAARLHKRVRDLEGQK
jgi:hypothetical protein